MSSLLPDGAVALVTGSTRGIGWATARALAEAGATVIVHGETAAAAEARATELGDGHAGLGADVTDGKAVSAMFQEIFRRWKGLDLVVNNAGIMEDARLGMITEEMLNRVLDVNTAGALRVLQGAARLIGRKGGGAIVNVASLVGLRGHAGQALYAASKAAVVGMTLAAAKELAPQKIRVNAVAPGYITTALTQDIDPAKLIIPLGRPGTPEDVADAIVFLCSHASRYITGQVLGVDGGMVV